MTDPAFFSALFSTFSIVIGTLLVSIIGGLFIAILINQPIFGQGIVRMLVIAPFFVMPTVAALIWKNMFMNPVYGLFAHAARAAGLQPFRLPRTMRRACRRSSSSFRGNGCPSRR